MTIVFFFNTMIIIVIIVFLSLGPWSWSWFSSSTRHDQFDHVQRTSSPSSGAVSIQGSGASSPTEWQVIIIIYDVHHPHYSTQVVKPKTENKPKSDKKPMSFSEMAKKPGQPQPVRWLYQYYFIREATKKHYLGKSLNYSFALIL